MKTENVLEIEFSPEPNQTISLEELGLQLRWLDNALYMNVSKDSVILAAGIRIQPREITRVPGLGEVILLAPVGYTWQDLGSLARIYYEPLIVVA